MAGIRMFGDGPVKNHGDRVASNGLPCLALPKSIATGWQQMLNVCATHRCPNLTTARYCTDCTAPARQASDARRPSAARRGYDRAWRKLRARHLASNPDCSVPDCPNPATDADHVVAITEGGPRLDATNLRSLCHPHHSKRTQRDQPGGWHKTGYPPSAGGVG